MTYMVTYRDEDGRHFWMGGNCWSSDKGEALVFLTPAYAAKQAALREQVVDRYSPRSKVHAVNAKGLVVVTSLRHEELFGWRLTA